jgi:hypothetical protein
VIPQLFELSYYSTTLCAEAPVPCPLAMQHKKKMSTRVRRPDNSL